MNHINDGAPSSPDLLKAIADYTKTNIIIIAGSDRKTIEASPESREYAFLSYAHSHPNQSHDIYSPLKLHNLKKEIKELLKMDTQTKIQPREFTFIVWNCRKMRSTVKADILNDIAVAREVDFILLQETHLSSDEFFKTRNYKIFRSDSESHSKGVAILINKRINAKTMVMQRDLEGRAIKVRVEDQDNNISYTISSIYQEPTADPNIINPIFFSADIIGSDCNEHETGLEYYHKYHYKNLTLKDEFHCPLSFSDHRMLIMNTKMKLTTKDPSSKITRINLEVAESNLKSILILPDREATILNPRVDHYIESPKLKHYDLNVDYIKLEQERIRTAKEKTTTKQQQIGYLLNRMNLSKNDWQILNSNINLKKKADIYSKNNDFPKILEGFKSHFQHNENEPLRNNTEQHIHELLESAIKLSNRLPELSYTPQNQEHETNTDSNRKT